MFAAIAVLAFLLAPGAPEPSVRPGVNNQYNDKELGVWVERFESAGREIFDQRHAILKVAGVRPGMRVADVGAGTGLFTLLFADAVGPRGKVFAVDIIPKFLTHLEKQVAERRLNNVVPHLGDPRTVALPPGSVDLVFLCDAYHHFEFPRSMNASMWKALRPGGTLLLIDFKRIPGKTPAATLEHVRAGEETFTKELVAAGFELVERVPLLEQNYVVRFRKPSVQDRQER
jgi:predicted methyltransferase